MATQGAVHLHNASVWRTHRSEIVSLGMGFRASGCSIGKYLHLEFDASDNWQPVQFYVVWHFL